MTAPLSNVLLAHSYFLYYDAKQTRKMRPYAPLATLIAASILREEGRSVSLFDSMLARGTEEFHATLARQRPGVVAFLEDNFNFLTKMCTTRMREAAFEMIAAARESGAHVIVNGSDATDRIPLYLEAGAEAVIVGETERTLPEVLAAWESGAALDTIAGLALPGADGSCAESSVRRTPPRPFVDALDELPLPDWGLVDVESYREAWSAAHGRLSWNVVSTRGCPYQCNWCAKPLYGRRYAQRSPGSVADEMAQLQQHVAPDHIWFADDIFGLTPKWIENFATEITTRAVRIPFSMQSRVDLMTESACEALSHAGAEEVWMGVESGSQAILDAMDKEVTVEEVREATRRLKSHGVRPSWFLQLGYPGETFEEILSTRDLIREEAPHDVGVSVSYPLPGTLFHERVQAELVETNWKDSDDLAMLFAGTYDTAFYRKVRDLLHEEAVAALLGAGRREREQSLLDAKWIALEEAEVGHRSAAPTRLSAEG